MAAEHLDASIAQWQALSDGARLARAVSTLAWVRLAQGVSDEAQDLAMRGLELVRQHAAPANHAWGLHIVGHVARNRGLYAEANAAFAESQALWQQLDHARDSAWALLNLGEVARGQRHYRQAQQLYDSGHARFADLDDRAGIVWAERNLGFVALAQEDAPVAAQYFAISLHRYEQLGNRRGIAVGLVGQAGAALTLDQPDLAARLLAAAEKLLADLGVRLDSTDYQAYEQIQQRLAEIMYTTTWEAAQQLGRGWSLVEALAAATSLTAPTVS